MQGSVEFIALPAFSASLKEELRAGQQGPSRTTGLVEEDTAQGLECCKMTSLLFLAQTSSVMFTWYTCTMLNLCHSLQANRKQHQKGHKQVITINAENAVDSVQWRLWG